MAVFDKFDAQALKSKDNLLAAIQTVGVDIIDPKGLVRKRHFAAEGAGIAPSALRSPNLFCPEGYYYSEKLGGCFPDVFNAQMRLSWPDAQSHCQRYHRSNLVTITSDTDNEIVSSMCRHMSCWIGFNDRTSEGDWVWVDETPVSFTAWSSGEPNHDHKGDGQIGENCAAFVHDRPGGMGGDGWNDLPCELHLPFLCSSHLQPPNSLSSPEDVSTSGHLNWRDVQHKLQQYDGEVDFDTASVVSKLNWIDARDYCRRLGSDLAMITSPQMNEYAAALCSGVSCWIGINDLQSEGVFTLVNGSHMDYEAWQAGQPDGWGEAGEDCVEMYPSGLWNDNDCSKEKRFLCNSDLDSASVVLKLNWTDARDYCRRLGSDLAMITSPQMNEYAAALCSDVLIGVSCWIGINDLQSEGVFTLVSGSHMNYEAWHAGQPDDDKQWSKTGEDCVEMYPSGLWNDNDCSKKKAFSLQFGPSCPKSPQQCHSQPHERSVIHFHPQGPHIRRAHTGVCAAIP